MLKRLGFVQVAFGGDSGGGGGGGSSSSGGSPSAANMARPAGYSEQVDRNRQASAMYAAQDAAQGGSSVPAHLQPYLPGGPAHDPSRDRTISGTVGSLLGRSSSSPTQVPVPGFTPSAIAPTNSPRPAPVGQGGGGIMSTAATYLPGGVNTRNPGSFVNETAANISLPSFGSGVSTERVANPFAGGSDGPNYMELLDAERRRIADLEAQIAGQSAAAEAAAAEAAAAAAAEAEAQRAAEARAIASQGLGQPQTPSFVSEAETLGIPQMPLSMDMLPQLTQFQQPRSQFTELLMQTPGFEGFPQPQPLPPMQQPMQQPMQPPVTFDSIYGPDFFPPRGLMG
jgi:hypothetical protein